MMRFKLLLLCLSVLSSLVMPVAVTQAEELPAPIKAIEARGVVILGTFDAPAGLRGYAARYNGQGIALYLTADGQHVLVGTLFNAQGEDLTEAPVERLVYEPLGKEMWAQMGDSTWIADGRSDARRIVYLFDDPNCPYCNKFWHQARPWVDSGQVQLRHIMVGMLRPDSAGKSAALLTAKRPDEALKAHELAGTASTLKALDSIPAQVQQQLDANLALMEKLGASATPAIFYLEDNGRLRMVPGVPPAEKLGEILGSK